jgi:uncharacterized protein (DUF2252 family)
MHRATPEERRKLGQAKRKKLARPQNAEFNPKDRLTSPFTLLQRSARGRVPALVKLKYELMMVSPFGYFRGAVPVMAADLAMQPNTGLTVQLCGDAHVRNLGAYAAEDGRLIFDINDFDETFRGPFEWDLKRMAASLFVAGREAGNKDGVCRRAVERCISSYSERMRGYATMPILDVLRHEISRIDQVEPVHLALQKAVRSTPLHTLEQLTELVNPVNPSVVNKKNGAEVAAPASKAAKPAGGKSVALKPSSPAAMGPRRFRENKPILTRVTGAKADAVIASLKAYKSTLEPQRQHFLDQYRPIDVAFKVVGTGSVGLRDYCIYFEGNGPSDPLFLQIKEEAQSAYAPYLTDPKVARHQGQRVVEGQRFIQRGTDPFLGYTTIAGRDYLVRQLNDHKGSIELTDLCDDGLLEYAQLCGELLARGHTRSGDPRQIAGYLGAGEGFADALATFGRIYADQTERDWTALKKAKK